MTLKIGNVELENNVILAPMAGVTDMPYRILCREQGAGLVCMEMVSAKAILYKNKNTQELLKVDERERPVSLCLLALLTLQYVWFDNADRFRPDNPCYDGVRVGGHNVLPWYRRVYLGLQSHSFAERACRTLYSDRP